MKKSCLENLKQEIRNIPTGNSNINIILKIESGTVSLRLNENIKINDTFINNISRIPFLEKIILK